MSTYLAVRKGVRCLNRLCSPIAGPASMWGQSAKAAVLTPGSCRKRRNVISMRFHKQQPSPTTSVAMAAEAEYWTFPTDKDQFDQDERISFSKLDNKYIAVQDDGTEYEFDEGLKRWIPIIDEALIEQQQRGYMIPGADDDDDSNNGGPSQNRKRKMGHSNDREDSYENNNHGPKSNKKKQRPPPQPKQNTAVYVTGLPSDATVEEVAELFSRKCGVIAEEIDSGRPRIKMYTDAQGNFKGDALIVFFKPQSVDMAIMLLDDTDFRFGDSSGPKMSVQVADSSYKKTKYDEGEGSGSGMNNTPKDGGVVIDKQAENKRMNQDKQKIIRKTQKLSAKLADWSDDEAPGGTGPLPNQKWDKVVILRHMFTLQELEEDPAALLDIKDDIREECETLGKVNNVILYDQEEEGIVMVKYGSRQAAEACLQKMHGRKFDGRTVEAFFATGREKFRKSKDTGGDEGEDSD